MDQRTQFIADHLRDSLSITELCALYGVSRKTGYKWIDRYLRHGPAGLEERSRRPQRSPRHTSDEVVTAILDARRRHPRWGGKKLLALLHKRHPRWMLPGRSTACDILSRHGMVPIRRQRRRLGHPGKPTSQILASNDLWSADYKGQFRTGDGRYCYPLTVADGFSRYLLGCQALGSTAGAEAKPIFTRLFQEYGLPRRIRTDNGVPFATTTLARLSKLSAWWVRLGILPELIEPGRPQQNGRHERMHRTLKAETTRPAAGNLAAQQRRFNSLAVAARAPERAPHADRGRVRATLSSTCVTHVPGLFCYLCLRPFSPRPDCGPSILDSCSRRNGYSLTRSARIRMDWGTVRPSAFAVFRLTASSNVVGCSIGSSPGLAPRRILSTKPAARGNN
jgi:transposase InsO family protein